MHRFKLAVITSVIFLLITPVVTNFPHNYRAIAQERFNSSETKTSIQGSWKWSCCEEKHSGTLKISQSGHTITGEFKDLKNGTGGNINGKIQGNTVEFDRTWDNKTQNFKLILSEDGKVLEGKLKGNRDESLGVEFRATRK